MRQFLLTAALISALLPSATHADIYRWVDERGSVYYGQEPPPGVKATRVAVTPAAPKAHESAAAKGKPPSRCSYYREQLQMVEGVTDAPPDARREAATQQLRTLVKENCS